MNIVELVQKRRSVRTEGEQYYIIGKVPNVLHSEEAFGYSFEKMVLYAQSLGLGTTWMAGTLDRALFEKAAALHDAACPLCSQLPAVAHRKSRQCVPFLWLRCEAKV